MDAGKAGCICCRLRIDLGAGGSGFGQYNLRQRIHRSENAARWQCGITGKLRPAKNDGHPRFLPQRDTRRDIGTHTFRRSRVWRQYRTFLFTSVLEGAAIILGMVAYFAGVTQAPITAFVIVMEMTDNHEMILPLMAAAFIAKICSRLVCPTPLFHTMEKTSSTRRRCFQRLWKTSRSTDRLVATLLINRDSHGRPVLVN